MNPNDNISETTGISSEKEFNAWADKLEKMSDLEASQEVFNRVMTHSDIDQESKTILKYAYEYSIKLIKQGKPLEPNLLKIYLEDLKGVEVNNLDMMRLFLLLGMCGINFK